MTPPVSEKFSLINIGELFMPSLSEMGISHEMCFFVLLSLQKYHMLEYLTQRYRTDWAEEVVKLECERVGQSGDQLLFVISSGQRVSLTRSVI